MNVLPLIQAHALKQRRLDEAQMLMAKAYRGIPYQEARVTNGPAVENTNSRQYRGVRYDFS